MRFMPIPANKSVDQLRNQVSRDALRQGAAETSNEHDVNDFVLRQQARLDALLATGPQLATFNSLSVGDWGERFVRVQTFGRDISLYGYDGIKLVEHLWNQLPSCRYKRFQELVCDKEDYTIPRPDTSAPCVVYPPRAELDRIPLAACFVSPAAVPFKLLVDLGIVPEPDRELTDLEALEIKAQPHVIASLKAVFEAAACLGPGNERILLVQQIDTSKYPEAIPLTDDKLGSILYLRENTSVNRSGPKRDRSIWQAPKQIAAYFSSAYAALRKTDHESSSYHLETMSLGELSQEWNELTTRARDQWRRASDPGTKAAIRSDLTRLVAKSREELKSVSNHLKREALNVFTELEERLQSGSNNITTHVTAADAAVRRLTKAMSTSSRRTGFNTTDAAQLTAHIIKAEHGFKLIADSLYGASARLQHEMRKSDGYFSQKGLSLVQREAATNSLLSRMGIPINHLDGIAHRPLRAFATRMRATYRQLQEALVSQDEDRVKRAVVKLVVLSKLQRANTVFEILRRKTVCSDPVPLKDLTRNAAVLRGLLDLRSVFPQTLVPEYQPTYRKIQRIASTIASGLETYQTRGLDLTERTQMYSRLRAYVDKTDLEADVHNLPES